MTGPKEIDDAALVAEIETLVGESPDLDDPTIDLATTIKPPSLDATRLSSEAVTVATAGEQLESDQEPGASKHGDGGATIRSEQLPHAIAVPGPEQLERREVLGRGGMGIVYAAQQPLLGRTVAVKQLRDEAATPQGAKAFVAEAVITGGLEHPNVVPIYALDRQQDGQLALVMKRIEGRTLAEMLAEEPLPRGRETIAHYVSILISVTNALAFAHSRGILHRDLKPENIMVGEFGEVLVLDWGIAVAFDPGLDGDKDTTRVGGLVGAPLAESWPAPRWNPTLHGARDGSCRWSSAGTLDRYVSRRCSSPRGSDWHTSARRSSTRRGPRAGRSQRPSRLRRRRSSRAGLSVQSGARAQPERPISECNGAASRAPGLSRSSRVPFVESTRWSTAGEVGATNRAAGRRQIEPRGGLFRDRRDHLGVRTGSISVEGQSECRGRDLEGEAGVRLGGTRRRRPGSRRDGACERRRRRLEGTDSPRATPGRAAGPRANPTRVALARSSAHWRTARPVWWAGSFWVQRNP